MMNNNNKWEPINGFPNYEIRNDSEIRNKKTGRILKQSDTNSGYPTVNLYNNGTRKTKGVHRIVAEQYVDGYRDGLEVNHKDGNKHNNDRANLEWVTHSGNERHAHDLGLKHGPNRTPVRVVESGEVFESIKECARAIGGDDTRIVNCLHGDLKTHLGLTFEYADNKSINAKDDMHSISRSYVTKRPYARPVRVVETGEEYPSIGACARAIGGDQGTISACLSGRHKTHHNYHYEYAD